MATLHLYNMADRGEKLQQLHCYHPFSDSRDIYLTKNHHENYSPKMVPTNPTGSWTNVSFHEVAFHDDVIKWKHFPRNWPLCGEFIGPGEFPTQRPVTRSFDVFFDLRLNKRLSKQSWGWWFETLSRPLWRHSNVQSHLHSWKSLGNNHITSKNRK